MQQHKISFITTVFNEEGTIVDFLSSLFSQSKLPDEIIIVDGGSSDLTVAKIKNEKLKMKNYSNSKFKILIKLGNRSVGRNEAIKRATGEIIVCSDAGCILDKNWVKKITKPFCDSKVDIVAGYYRPIVNSIFEKCLAVYTCVMPDRIDDENFLPSSRSVAFKKEPWGKVGGYPEDLDTCEDLVFAKKLKKTGFNFKFKKEAIVYWPQRTNFADAFVQFFNYAKGDGMARYFRFPQTPFLFFRFVLALCLLLAFSLTKNSFYLGAFSIFLILYILWSIQKNQKYIKKIEAFFILPVLQLISDMAVLLGMTLGLIKSFNFK